jgi:hypothetical protein
MFPKTIPWCDNRHSSGYKLASNCQTIIRTLSVPTGGNRRVHAQAFIDNSVEMWEGLKLVAVININAAQLLYQSLLVIPMLCKFQKDEDQSRCYCIAGSPQLNLLLMLERDIPSAIIIVTASPLSQSRSSIIVFVFLEASMSQCDTSALSPSLYAKLVYIAKGYRK